MGILLLIFSHGNTYSSEINLLSVKWFIGAQNKGNTFLLQIFMVGNIFTQEILCPHMYITTREIYGNVYVVLFNKRKVKGLKCEP